MSKNSLKSTERDTTSPWSRPGLLFAGAGVALIVILLVVVLSTTGTSSGEKRPAAQPAPAPASTTQPGRDEGPTTVPTAPPDHVQWRLFNTIALPYSSQAGPRSITDSTATGYAHTPTGALIATAQISIRKLLAPRWRDVVAHQVVDTPGRAAFVDTRGRISDDDPGTGFTPTQFGQFSGFRFVNYSPDVATIELVTHFPTGAAQVQTLTVQWRGDWKQALQPDGSDSPTAQSAQDSSGYTPWGGV